MATAARTFAPRLGNSISPNLFQLLADIFNRFGARSQVYLDAASHSARPKAQAAEGAKKKPRCIRKRGFVRFLVVIYHPK
jgi:hypothetical protein